MRLRACAAPLSHLKLEPPPPRRSLGKVEYPLSLWAFKKTNGNEEGEAGSEVVTHSGMHGGAAKDGSIKS